MRLLKEIVKEALKIILGVIWILSFWLGYMWMSIPELMIMCFMINTVCTVIMYYMIKDSDKTEEDKEVEVNESNM